jgi:hypothetical protein
VTKNHFVYTHTDAHVHAHASMYANIQNTKMQRTCGNPVCFSMYYTFPILCNGPCKILMSSALVVSGLTVIFFSTSVQITASGVVYD